MAPKRKGGGGPSVLAQLPELYRNFALESRSIQELLSMVQDLRIEVPADTQFLPDVQRSKAILDVLNAAYVACQRLPSLFPGSSLSRKVPVLDFSSYPTWPGKWSRRGYFPIDDNYTDERHVDTVRRTLGVANTVGGVLETVFSGGEAFMINHGTEVNNWLEARRTHAQLGDPLDCYGERTHMYIIHGERPSSPALQLFLYVEDVRSIVPVPSKAVKFDPTNPNPGPLTQQPVIIVRYAIMFPHLFDLMLSFNPNFGEVLRTHDVNKGELEHLVRLILFNATLLSPAYRQSTFESKVPPAVSKLFGVSFIVPVHPPPIKKGVKIGTKTAKEAKEVKLRCGWQGCDSVATAFCGKCRSVPYCSTEHSALAWPTHKRTACVRSAASALFQSRALASHSVLVPAFQLPFARGPNGEKYATTSKVLNWKGEDKTITVGEVAKNVHAGERFVLKLQTDQGATEKGRGILIYDAQRTVVVKFGRDQTATDSWTDELDDAHQALIDIIETSGRWDHRKSFVFATRVGDQLQIDVEDLPSQDLDW